MPPVKKPVKVPHSKTLDSIASLPKPETNGVNGCKSWHFQKKDDETKETKRLFFVGHEVEFKRSGILIMAKSAIEGSGDDLLFNGTLTISKKTQWQIPTVEWQPSLDQDQNQECQYGSSFSDREWTLVNDQLSKRKRQEKLEPLSNRYQDPNAWRPSRRRGWD